MRSAKDWHYALLWVGGVLAATVALTILSLVAGAVIVSVADLMLRFLMLVIYG